MGLSRIEKTVVEKLYSKKVFGSKHLSFNTILRCGWKSHERGEVKSGIERLIRLGLIRWYDRSR